MRDDCYHFSPWLGSRGSGLGIGCSIFTGVYEGVAPGWAIGGSSRLEPEVFEASGKPMTSRRLSSTDAPPTK